MAPIDRLPVELIVMICRFIHPTDIQMDLVYANNPEEDDNGIRRVLRPGWTAVFSFSLVNKKYHHIIGNDLYHTISVHGPSPRPLVSLLRLVTKKPDIGAAVKRLHLGLTFDDPAVKATPLTAYDVLFVGQLTAAAKLPYPNNKWRIPRRRQYRTGNDPSSDSIPAYVEYGLSDFHELLYYLSGTCRTTLIVRLLLRKLNNIEQLGCALPHGVFTGVNVDEWFNLGPRLPHLTTLALRPDRRRFSGKDFGVLSRLAPHAKCLYLQLPDFDTPEIEIAPLDKQTASFLQ